MWNSRMSWKFWLVWFFSNSLIIAVSFTLLGMWEQGSTPPRYFPRSSPNIVGCLGIALMLGVVQWLILSGYREGMSGWWVITNAIGFPLSACVSLILYEFDTFAAYNQQDSLETHLWFLARSGAIGGVVGGVMIGIAQSCILRIVSWIYVSAVAWAIAWPIGWVLGLLAGYIAVNDFLIEDTLNVELGFLGLGLGVASSFITGSGLVWLSWWHQRSSRGDHPPHRVR
jgi:hypothetical protein